jgi:hypothetical protein
MTRISSIVLYIVLAITLPLLLVFYFGESMVNTEKYKEKVQKIENPAPTTGVNIARDLQSADSLAVGGDSASVQMVPVTPAPPAEKVRLSFFEKLAYYRMDVNLIWGYILLIISGLTAVIFPIVYAIVHPTNLVRGLLVLVGAGILILFAYLLSSGEPMQIIGYEGTDASNPSVLKLIDTGLIFSYFVFGCTLIAIVVTETINYFK